MRNLLKVLISLLSIWLITAAQAATIRVGPLEHINRIADAAQQAQDGDTIEIMPGEYRGDVAVWPQKKLTIRGIGQRPVLIADGKIAEGKAIWVLREGDFNIENIEFRGARADDGNGAGIRLEKGTLLVRNCSFFENQMGLLTANFPETELSIENSLFAQAPRQMDSLPHLLYVGKIKRLSLRGSRFHGGFRGHLVKSRARINDIRYNLLYDGPNGEASYELNLPNGGDATLVGNIIGQSDKTQNLVVVSYGEEGHVWPDSRLTLIHNTLLSERKMGGWFLRVAEKKFADPPRVYAVNNLTVGLGLFSLLTNGEFHGNLPLLHSLLTAPEALDFQISSTVPDFVTRNMTHPLPDEWKPDAEFMFPIGTRPLTPRPNWQPGAVQ
jgi:hypothetical protein